LNNATGAGGPCVRGSTSRSCAMNGSFATLRMIPITQHTTVSDIRRMILLHTTGSVPRGVARWILFGDMWRPAVNARDEGLCRFEALEEGRVLGRGAWVQRMPPLISAPHSPSARTKQQQAQNLPSTSLFPTHHSLVISRIVAAPLVVLENCRLQPTFSLTQWGPDLPSLGLG
jgi:hypothetical protein